MNYKPGDIVNDHVLTSDLQWIPLPPKGLQGEPLKVELGERRTPHSVVFEGLSWIIAVIAGFWAIILLAGAAESGSWGIAIGFGVFTMIPLVATWAVFRMLSQRSQR